MRFNERELRYAGKHLPGDHEGRLSHKQPKEGYRERLFKLRGNLLYYTRITDGAPESEVLGVLLLEKFRIQKEENADQPFVFSIGFDDEPDRKHMFSCSSIQQCETWMSAIQNSSYRNVKDEFCFLQDRLRNLTGMDTTSKLIKKSVKLAPRTEAVAAISQTPPVPRRSAPPPPLPSRPDATKENVPTGLLIDL